jgi:hypothetical protein
LGYGASPLNSLAKQSDRKSNLGAAIEIQNTYLVPFGRVEV